MSIEEFGSGQRWGPISYAQHGDDLFIINLFELMGIEKPSYLDIGANHPFSISNTALLYKRGSRGINVEANSDLMGEFFIHRPEDLNLNLAIGPEPGRLEFFMFRDGNGLNTFDPIERDQTIASGNPVKEIREIKVRTLDDIIHTYCNGIWPDLLSIDIEGLDYDVLKSSDTIDCYDDNVDRPKIVCVETRRHNSGRMKQMMECKGYHFIARLAENMIFADRDVF